MRSTGQRRWRRCVRSGRYFASEARDRDYASPTARSEGPIRAAARGDRDRDPRSLRRAALRPRAASRRARGEVAEYSQTKHGLGLSSGTDALLLALMALDIGAGDEVITTPFTFFATAGVIARLGARPFFCDIDPRPSISIPQAVRTAIAERCELRGDRLVNRATGGVIKALIPVHLYGQMADLDAFIGHRAPVSASRRRRCRAGDRCRARGRAAGGQRRRHRLPVVLSDQEPRCIRRRRHVRQQRQRLARAACASCACTAASRSTTTR